MSKLTDRSYNILQRQLRFAQKTKEWLHARHAILTSSDVASALDLNKYQSALELLKRKCSALGDNRLQSNESIKWGEMFEPIARNIFQQFPPQVFQPVYKDNFDTDFKTGENSKVIECNLVIHNFYKWLGASPDGVLLNGKLLEIKCPYRRIIRQGVIPHVYWIQVQIQLEVCDVDEAYFFQCKFDNGTLPFSNKTHVAVGQLSNKSYWGLRSYTLDVIKRDRKWFREHIDQLQNFWNQVLHYRIVGLAKLMNDIGSRTPHYNLKTGQIELIDSEPVDWITPTSTNDNTLFASTNCDMLHIEPPTVSERKDNLNSETPDLSEYKSNLNSETPDLSESLDNSPEVLSLSLSSPSQLSLDNSPDSSDMSPVLRPLSNELMIPMRDWSQWVYASATHNFAKKDPLLDWLNEYGKGKRKINTGNPMGDSKIVDYERSINKNSSFLQYIRAKGMIFEEQVIAYLYKKFPKQIITCANPSQARSIRKFNETIDLMNKGTPIIYQAVLHESKSRTYGIADLLVRSDFINKIFTNPTMSIDQTTHGCKFSRRWHYVVIDIKNAKLYLACDGIHLLNSGSMPAYKTQVWVYTHAVGVIQEYIPPCGYILGNKWEYTKCSNTYYDNGWFDRAGVIDYSERDAQFKRIAKEAVEWIREIRTNGSNWSISPPSRLELYPNMKNRMDNTWYSTKKTIAEDIGDITMIWNCGVTQRDIAHSKGVTSWKDPRCTAALMNIKGKKTAPIVDAFLNINRGTDHYHPKHIEHRLPRTKIEMFMDFETVNSLVEPIGNKRPITSYDRFLFMIGFGWRVNNGLPATWTYENFTTNKIDNTSDEECKIFVACHKRMVEILSYYDALDDFTVYHWSQAERYIYDSVHDKYKHRIASYLSLMDLDKRWFDLHYLFKKEKLVIKGTFGFGLKQVANQLYNLGYIKTQWADSSVSDGLNAMIKAMECSDDAIKRDISMIELPLMKEIIYYNEVDCRVLLEILSFLRHNLVRRSNNNSTNNTNNTKRKSKRTRDDLTKLGKNKRIKH